ncbi:MAG: response regulator [Planctomycetota bacterium]|nr:response regulator [Planctomycetota bacterium]
MSPTVLIVDDSLTVRMDLDEAFREAGFGTSQCATLAAARDALGKTVFSLLVLDVLLPDGDGVDLLKELRQGPATAGLPVLMLTSETEVRDRVRGLSSGANEYVGKPYDTAHVLARARELVRRSEAEEEGGDDASVLIIDDSETFRESLKAALEAAAYRVYTAGSGEEGLRRAADLRPAMIVVDGVMPGIDGATVIRRIRSDVGLRHTPCLLLTASEGRDREVLALEAGADAYVRKEADLELILARVAALRRSSRDTLAFGHRAGILGPKRILAVDDSFTYLQELAAQLDQEGYDTVLARSGQEALDLLAVQPVDCILLDLLMPEMSGEETCRRIKSSPAWRDIPLIILTALDENAAMIQGINAGADDYITKSGEFEVLKARVRAQLRRKQFEDENRRIREQLLKKELEAAEARASRELAETRARLLADLQHKNQELESFSYSVSHDLRAPLRAIAGFSSALRDDYADKLGDEARHFLRRICDATERMSELIDALLELSRVSRREMNLERVDLTRLAQSIVSELQVAEPERRVEVEIEEGLTATADLLLLRAALTNLFANAWKYTSKREVAQVRFGRLQTEKGPAYRVQDNGAGFDMAYAHKLFGAFQRLHADSEFKGTGVGLATVQRIVRRHGGEVWAEGRVDHGASIYFVLPEGP